MGRPGCYFHDLSHKLFHSCTMIPLGVRGETASSAERRRELKQDILPWSRAVPPRHLLIEHVTPNGSQRPPNLPKHIKRGRFSTAASPSLGSGGNAAWIYVWNMCDGETLPWALKAR